MHCSQETIIRYSVVSCIKEGIWHSTLCDSVTLIVDRPASTAALLEQRTADRYQSVHHLQRDWTKNIWSVIGIWKEFYFETQVQTVRLIKKKKKKTFLQWLRPKQNYRADWIHTLWVSHYVPLAQDGTGASKRNKCRAPMVRDATRLGTAAWRTVCFKTLDTVHLLMQKWKKRYDMWENVISDSNWVQKAHVIMRMAGLCTTKQKKKYVSGSVNRMNSGTGTVIWTSDCDCFQMFYLKEFSLFFFMIICSHFHPEKPQQAELFTSATFLKAAAPRMMSSTWDWCLEKSPTTSSCAPPIRYI